MKHLYSGQKLALSFEIYPPKTAKGLEALYLACKTLSGHRPAFISCTYGAGGSTRGQTLEILEHVHRQFNVPVTAHFTCVGSTVPDIRDWLTQAANLGIHHIMALRGDPPQGESRFVPTPGGLPYASELVKLIRREFPGFGIGVAGYPETHREAPSPEADLRALEYKVRAGADAVFTQLFFDNTDFFRFRDACQKHRISVPIVPGILPVLGLGQVQRITKLCGSRLPTALATRLESQKDHPEAQMHIGIEHAIHQCEGLIRAGVPGIHFYVLNRADTLERILNALSI